MGQPIVLLTIDDDAALRRSVRGYFEDFDFEVLEAEDGKTGLAVFRNERPDVVLVDLRMPGLGGLEVIQAIAEEAPEIPVIVLSGTGVIGDAIDAIRKGAWDFVTKPIVEMAQLQHVVSIVLERARLRAESRQYREHLEDEVALRTRELAEINNRLKAIVQSTRSVAACSSLQEVSSRLLEEFASNMAAEGGSIYLVEDSKLVLKYSLDDGHTTKQIPLPPPENSPIQKALGMKQALVIRDLRAEREIRPSGWSGYRDPSLLIFPLLDERNEPFGVITLHNKTNPPFTEQDRELGIILSSYSCEAIRASRAIEALRDSEERFRLAWETTPDALSITRLEDGSYVDVNEGYTFLTGYTRDEIVGKSALDLPFWPDPRDRQAIVAQLRKHGHVRNFETKFRRRDGEIRSILASAGLMMLSGDPHLLAVAKDIEELKRADAALRESEGKYRLLAENVSDVIFTMDLNLRVTYVSPSVERLNGWAASEWLAFQPSDYLTQSSLELVLKVLGDELAIQRNPGVDPNRVITLELEQYRKDGTTFWTEVTARFLYDNTGGVAGIIGATRDITERKHSQEQLHRLFSAVQQAGETIMITEVDGTLLYVNPAFENTTGFSVDEVMGKTATILKSGKHNEAYYEEMWSTIRRGEVWRGRFTSRKKDGSLFEETATISPIKDESGQVVYYVMVGRDVTSEMMLQEQLNQAQKMEAIGTLAGGIAHDFNNLLQAILGYSDLLLIKKGPTDPDRKKLEVIQHAARDGADLVSRILTFSRKGEFKMRPIDLNEEIHRVEKLLRRILPRMIQIDLLLAGDLRIIDADPGQIEQVIINLGVNAQHAMTDGGRLVIETSNVSLRDEYLRTHLKAKPGHYVLLTVSDNGIGMQPEVMDRIFEPFFTTKANGEGTGLGLAMVHGIVAQHGGYVRCYSEPGRGTSFKIYFPVSASEFISDQTLTREMPAFGTETILLVDDDDRIRDMGQRMIEMGGYKVILARSGEEALDIYAAQRTEISLVILDLNMPGMGGKRCLEKILEIYPLTKVIVASGYSSNGLALDDKGIGARDFISKPYDAREILFAIRRVLDKGRL
jgi:PAS domain S-box-containing protein